jgi:hypothetical protein
VLTAALVKRLCTYDESLHFEQQWCKERVVVAQALFASSFIGGCENIRKMSVAYVH